MIEVHVVNAFIKPEFVETGWFSVLNFINGLVAPSFTFVAGFAFIISSKNNLDEMRKFGRKFWKKVNRILLLLFIGYSLHMPEFSYYNIVKWASRESIIKWYNVDVLQCIGVSLLILFLSRLLIKSDKIYNYFILISTIAILIISPMIWNVDFARYLPMPIACYFNAVHGSFFPLFPWMGFLFAGAYTGILFMKFRSRDKEEFYINRMMMYGIAGFVVSAIVLYFLKGDPSFEAKPDPFFFIQRFGLVILALGLCWKYVKIYGEKASFVTDISRESLVIYFLHLQVIYRKIWNGHNLEYYINFSFGITELLCATLILIASMIAVASVWGSFKARFPKTSTAVIRLTLVGAVALFFYLT